MPTGQTASEGACAPQSNGKPTRVDSGNTDGSGVARGATKEYFETRPPPSIHGWGTPRRPGRLCGWLTPPPVCAGRRLGDPPLMVLVHHNPMENLQELTLAIWTVLGWPGGPQRYILDHNATHCRHSGGLPRPLPVELMGSCCSVSLLSYDKPLTTTPMFSCLKTLCGKPESGAWHK